MARKAPTKAPARRKAVKPAPAKAVPARDLTAPETVVVWSKRISCDGVGGVLGHPRV